ncbi:thioredoxin family protein [archaeon]|nr:thioredoxin family protein [archaeon]
MTLNLKENIIHFNLLGTDGKYHNSKNYENSKLLAIIFSCNHCPYVVASEREFIQIQSEYRQFGLQIIAINSNAPNLDYPGDSYENMKKRAEEKQFNFPYLIDDDQSLAKDYGATRTPEIFLFNENRNLIYKGRINDNPMKHNEITRYDFQEAIKEAIKNNDISIAELPALGCSIKFIE